MKKTIQPKLKAITIRRLRLIAECIVKDPDLYDQQAARKPQKNAREFHSCLTAGCILGWANYLFPRETKIQQKRARKQADLIEDLDGVDDPTLNVFVRGAARLHLSAKQANQLWISDYWPALYRNGNSHANWRSKESAVNAADRIRHFIKTNGKY